MTEQTVVINPDTILHISGCGRLNDDEIDICYKDGHVFEISFDSKKMSVVLAAAQRSIRDCPHPAPSSATPHDKIPPCDNCLCETPNCRKNCRYYEMYLFGVQRATDTICNQMLDELKNAFRIADEDSCGSPWTKLQIIKLIDEYQESLRREVPE